MRYDKLVEMVKKVGKERLGESNHSARYGRGSKHMSGRYKPGVKLAQEATKDIVAKDGKANKGNPELNLEPMLHNTIDQSR